MKLAPQPDVEASRWYEDHVRRFGHGYRALGFGHRSSQEKRFNALLALGPLEGCSVLDVGCGFGDLLAYLRERGVHATYTGIDLCPPMIERCRKRYPESAERFVAADALMYEPQQQFDYVLASGLFGLLTDGIAERIPPTLARLFSWCRIGVAVNFLSSRYTRRSPQRLYVDPSQALALGLALTPAVRLDHSYLPNDFTLSLYRQPPWENQP